jgi:hypothetical protein|tara:strand:+ start:1244 stop:1666 length:423 start_codon:yes stop_codon:yes gene_type:complete
LLLTAGFNPFQQAFFTTSLGDIDEELPPYFDHLSENDINWSRREKQEYKKRFGLNLAAIEDMHYYQRSPVYEKYYKGFRNHISGVHTYDLLRNPIYSGGFQYIPYALPKISVPGHPGKCKELDRKKVNLDGDTNFDNNEA